MSEKRNQNAAQSVRASHLDSPVRYQLRVEGHLSAHWATWFEGFIITPEEDGSTLLTGPVVDQAELHGLLKKVRDLGMTLLLVKRVYPDRLHVSEDASES